VQAGPDSNIPVKEQAATTSQTQAVTASQAQAATTSQTQAVKQAEVTSRVKESPAAPEDDIFFMVQISAMPRNRELSQNQVKNIDTITKIDAGERVKYAAGRFKVYDDALKYRRMLTASFPDAFVIAVRNGKIVPLREAIDLKKKK